MKMCILGCGYIGKALAKFWNTQGHHVTVTTRQPSRVQELAQICNTVVLLQSPKDLEKALEHQNVLVITVAPDTHHHSDYETTYLKTAQNVVTHLPPSMQHIIYTSSISVYGDQQGRWVDESHPLSPQSPQASLLCQTEETLQKAAVPVCILRLGEIYGPQREFADKLRTVSQPRPGTGCNYINIIHRNTIIAALDFAFQHHLKGIYNLCEDVHIARKEFYNALCEKEGLPPIIWDPSKKSLHGGNKRVSSKKIQDAGLSFS